MIEMKVASIQESGLVIAAGTYDGVSAGWEFQKEPAIDQKNQNHAKHRDIRHCRS
jgi:hypothetical protein